MKGLNLFLAACLTVPTMDGAVADTIKNNRENAIQRNSSITQTRTNITSKRATQPRTTNQKNIVPRTTSVINVNNEKNRSATPARDIVSRTAKKTNILTRTPKTTGRTATPVIRTLSRAATNTTKTRESVMQRDFGKCKSVFFDCMDEFCANKDAQLKRCACSTRANEFRNTQKSLNNVEDKLLDFSQRLLQVNMDPADAAVINIESEGERAYNQTRDKTASKKTLDEIAKKLNTSFDSAENSGGGMSALTWSLDADSAFDSVDSLSGTSTTAKSGTALRNAALPICRDMAVEVCDDDDMSLVENSYNMAIEQDCNTVQKSYATQTQNARTKILESGALLDMTRLNDYQDKNSDDVLTCKSKMLNMLTDTNVCGTDLTKCLDISGRYINPTTGEAFLSPELINIATLLVRPSNGDTWSRVPANSSFVSFLNTKKKYIEPATKNCESIADDVWDGFIDDALAKIKLAQNAKLEDVRQSCTKLLSECLDNAKTELSEFDSRALSTFGVMTDKTANALCENVKTSCAAIMAYSPDDTQITFNSDDPNSADYRINWTDGTTDIAARETYNTIINTCREVGRDCIINSCKSITGNFGLCESINGSVNRHSILTRAACWDQVYECVAKASEQSLSDIRNILPTASSVPQTLYERMYGASLDNYEQEFINSTDYATLSSDDQQLGIQDAHSVYDVCRRTTNNVCAPVSGGNDPQTAECYKCRITEQIWGNCKSEPNNKQTNAILIPDDANQTTLLSWFAKNTHTQGIANSCATSICPAGKIDMLVNGQTQCKDPSGVLQCPSGDPILCEKTFTIPVNGGTKYNCCTSNMQDSWGNCCENGYTSAIVDHMGGLLDSTVTSTSNVCTRNNNISSITLVAKYQTAINTNTSYNTYIFCDGTVSGNSSVPTELMCSGQYFSLICYTGTNDCQYYVKLSVSSAQDLDDIYNTNRNYNINTFINYDKDDTNYCPINNVYKYKYKLEEDPTATHGVHWTCATNCPNASGWVFSSTTGGSCNVNFN